VLLSAPLALASLGLGIGTQAILRPSMEAGDPELLEALIAEPTRPAAQPEGSGATATATTGTDGALDNLRAHRAETEASGTALAEPRTGNDLDLEIRVALLRLPPQPSLGSSGTWRARDRDGRVLREGAGELSGRVVDLLASRAEVWIEPGGGAHLLADGQPYDGRFRLLRGVDGLQVVNHVPLESYIASVVGAEMPSGWNLEALKAQAIAARSYALAHMARPASGHWHLGDTTRWQAYRGLVSVTDRTRAATGATSGVILSYQGGIVESLYAATEQISREAHGHLGASMSQHGAQDLAQQGLRYNEILARYYQGASLARLEAGAG
jgi:hypothetical protein